MSRTSIATPCPAPYILSSLPIPTHNRRLSTASNASFQDDTAEIEYTRAIQLEFQDAKPRRRSTFHKNEKKRCPVTIFEDVIEDEELVVPDRVALGGSTLLGKPAQKIPRQAIASKFGDNEALGLPVSAKTQTRRPSIAARDALTEVGHHKFSESKDETIGDRPQEKPRDGLKKEPRRRTIFIPSEDTTMLTIHPGADPSNPLNDTFQLSNYVPQPLATQPRSPEERQAAKKPRMSLAIAPKRVPLQQVTANDGNVAGLDVPGQNGGKENLPPFPKPQITDNKPLKVSHSTAPRRSRGESRLFEPTAASKARQNIVSRQAVPLPNVRQGPQGLRNNAQVQTSPRMQSTLSSRASLSLQRSPPPPIREAETRCTTVQTGRGQFQHRKERWADTKTARLQQYPVLSENLAQPELYEDSWLKHQEIALTELVNHIFTSAQPRTKHQQEGNASLRERMLHIYHQPRVATLHRRLKASLLCGALSRPRDLSSPPNPQQDLGLRKRFLSLWLDSYDTAALRSAAEVVFGRQLPKPCKAISDVSGNSLDRHQSRRALIGFLETFLVEVDDAEEPEAERGDDANGHWRKMVLRSLMLVWILDQAKTAGIVRGCLFKSGSTRKSSVAMLHTLSVMLLPSTGDVIRILRHLDCEVFYGQDPLDEVIYRIENIAVDLRDGILLTRLAELLLFSPDRVRDAEARGDATVTIQLPDATILESALSNIEDRRIPPILSQHLKMPCLGRAQKIYNVQIAISALRDHGRLGQDASQATADDIVDGHRENSLSLLWSLVSQNGLGYLVDFREVMSDIRRVTQAETDLQPARTSAECLPQAVQESLLKKWASAYAVLRGIRISNLTTSFADGAAYAAIMDAFADYVQVIPKTHSHSANASQVEAQLQALGCSNAFIKQLKSTNGTIPSRKTTISNLAFLASRLLPMARQHNAACTIQRVFRLRRSRIVAGRRIALMRIAHACATVVQTQNRLVTAATVLQRNWRGVLDARIRRLNGNVEAFQVIAKSWIVRRQAGHTVRKDVSNNVSLRVMGGW